LLDNARKFQTATRRAISKDLCGTRESWSQRLPGRCTTASHSTGRDSSSILSWDWYNQRAGQNNMKHEATARAEPSLEPQKFSIGRFHESLRRGDLKERVPLCVAILSVSFQFFLDDSWNDPNSFFDKYTLILIGLAVVISAFLTLFAQTSRIAIMLFIAIAAVEFIPRWTVLANHTFLALWTIPFAILFKEWWKSDLYSFYLRYTLGIVMFGAFAQKVLAGTYIDGSYLYLLSNHGSLTERMFSFACDSTSGVPCMPIRIISIFILLWQLAVGILLVWGVRSLVFLSIEIGFLLGAGLFADEMNFQVLNIALLCIVFRVGMPIGLLAACVALLMLDLYKIDYILKLF
jgi:hypothetical protein